MAAVLSDQKNLTIEDVDPAADLIGRLKAFEPDALIFGDPFGDLRVEAVAATVRLSGRVPKLILMKEDWTPLDIMDGLRNGVSGFLTPNDRTSVIVATIFQATKHRGSVKTEARAPQYAMAESWNEDHARREPENRPVPLTTREIEILRCAADGITVSETARLLNISLSTVKNHRHNIFAKLGVSNAVAAVAYANRNRLL